MPNLYELPEATAGASTWCLRCLLASSASRRLLQALLATAKDETAPLYFPLTADPMYPSTSSSKPYIFVADTEIWGKTKGFTELSLAAVLLAEANKIFTRKH